MMVKVWIPFKEGIKIKGPEEYIMHVDRDEFINESRIIISKDGSRPFKSSGEFENDSNPNVVVSDGFSEADLLAIDYFAYFRISLREKLGVSDEAWKCIVSQITLLSVEGIFDIRPKQIDEWAIDFQDFKDIDVARMDIGEKLSTSDRDVLPRHKYVDATVIAYKYFYANGSFYWNPLCREVYWFDGDLKVLFIVDSEAFKTLCSNRLAVNQADIAFKWIVSGIRDRISGFAKHVEPKRFSYYDSESKTLFFNHKPGRVLRLDGENILEVDNGDPILFLWDDSCESVDPVYDTQGLLNSLLLSKLSLDTDGCDLKIAEVVIIVDKLLQGILFRSIIPARPVSAFVGPQGSGKTIYAVLLGLLLFGKRFAVLGIEAQKPDGAIAYVTNNVYGVLDNADEPIFWLPDLIARISTGMSIPRRKLYTTNELVNYPTDIFLAITARQTPWARPDVVDRLFLFPTKRPEEFFDEDDLKRNILCNRSKLIGELLTRANSVVHRLRNNSDTVNNSPMRLSAFYNFAVRTSDDPATVGTILRKMISTQEDLSLEQSEAFVTLLKKWIDSKIGGQTTLSNDVKWINEMSPSVVFAELFKYAKDNSFNFKVETPLSLGHILKAHINTLRISDIIFQKSRENKGIKWKFGVKEPKKEDDKQQPSGKSDLGQSETLGEKPAEGFECVKCKSRYGYAASKCTTMIGDRLCMGDVVHN